MRFFGDVASRVEDPYLARAVALAERARGATSPNPLVGCVIVSDGRIVGEGFHARAGEPHAEVIALADAASLARGADVYVTLEPCAHTGKTPPCADALIAARVKRVTVGLADPTPLAGGGAQRLRDAGIDVTFAEDPTPFAEQNEEWLKFVATGMPFVTVKAALTLDARPALVPGRRASITGESGARVTQRLRTMHAAIGVGAATVESDNPALTVRSVDGTLGVRQPLRVVFARHTLATTGARLFADGATRTIVVSPEGVPQEVETLTYPAGSGLRGMLQALGGIGVDSVLIEAGPRLLTALWSERVIDQLVTVTAGGMGGAKGSDLFHGAADVRGDAVVAPMRPVEAGIVGDVSVVVWRPKDADETS